MQHQRFLACIMQNTRRIELHQPIVNQFTAFMCEHRSDNIASASYSCAPRECQPFCCGLSMLPSNHLHWIVTKYGFMWSVFSICPCIQLHNYACNISQIWLLLLIALASILKNPHSALQQCDCWQSLESDYLSIEFPPRSQIQISFNNS